MQKIQISDVTMKQTGEGFSLSFKEKIELAKLLDKLGADVIELEGIENLRIDTLRIKAIAAAVGSTVAVPVLLNGQSVQNTWNALQVAKKPRLQVCAPVSSVQMEYIFHKKPDALLAAMTETVAACRALCADVELVAEDATRADPAFLNAAVKAAVEAGATTVTLCDSAGSLLPAEVAAFLAGLEPLPAHVRLGIWCADTLSLADACAIAAVGCGITEVKAAAHPLGNASLANVARVIKTRGEALCGGTDCNIHTAQLSRTLDQIRWLCQPGKGKLVTAPKTDEDLFLTAHDSAEAVTQAAARLGYELSGEDSDRVYEAFRQIAGKKDRVTAPELDAIIASASTQVPSTYSLDTYVITSGNTISATAHIKLRKNGQTVEGVVIGDGSIDAAFQAIEKITGCHYELDDFQLQAVTEGREAMGQTVVKLRSGGKVYSGRGISTDIVGAGIQAYLSALNKIVYEEAEA